MASPVAQYWHHLQYLEAASVPAFRELAVELANHGAPSELVGRALTAADEEVEHARLCAVELARYGLRPAPVGRLPVGTRSLFDLAEDNAREGCVRESFGALLAQYQAERAPTAELQSLFSCIAEDESSHAQLAWDIHAWATDCLSPAEVRQIEEVIKAEVRSLASVESSRACEEALSLAGVGLQDSAARTRLVHDFARAITDFIITTRAA
jgi:hypothetical protein